MANTPRLVTTKQAEALAELYVWEMVVEILEGSTAPRDASGQKAARKVIAIAKAEQKKLFRKYDADARHDDFAPLQAEASTKAIAWARPVYAKPVGAPEAVEGEMVDVEFHLRAERPEGEGWRPLVFASPFPPAQTQHLD